MENSTKALLIAASVLIVLVLISVGIKILSSTTGVQDEVEKVSDTMSTSMFNSQFNTYFGNTISGSQAKALVSKVMANNATSEHIVYVNLYPNSGSGYPHKKSNSELQTIYNEISPSAKYKIQPTQNCSLSDNGFKNGYLACINIDEV